MNIYQFMSDSPGLTALMSVLVFLLLHLVLFKLPNRIIRHFNIKKHGWPPEHLDADGSFKQELVSPFGD